MKRGHIFTVIGGIGMPITLIFLGVTGALAPDDMAIILPVAVPLFFITMICLVIGISLGASNNLSKKAKTFPLVTGTLLDVKQTGGTRSAGPELTMKFQFTTEGGRQVTASQALIIPVTDLDLFKPGKTFLIRYNPQNPLRIAIDFEANSSKVQP
ncbi:MAG: DUF3592 domain-containing protein [Desulfuromonadales bacterium]|nr:DUF3592 domain-containing protein [Desulfuromonadales bacterium]